MVPYTFKTMSAPLMAVLWAVLVFAGIVGLVLALKPETHSPPTGPAVQGSRPARKPLIDPDFSDVFGGMLLLPMMMLGLMVVFGVGLALMKAIAWVVAL